MTEIHRPVIFSIDFEFPDEYTAGEATGPLSDLAAAAAKMTGSTLVRAEVIEGYRESTATKSDFSEKIDPTVDLFDPTIQDKLDAPLATALMRDGVDNMSQRKRMIKILTDTGLPLIRDVLTSGGEAAQFQHGFGERSMMLLRSELQNFLPEIPLVDTMDAADAALFCTSLGQFSLTAVSDTFGRILGTQRASVADGLRLLERKHDFSALQSFDDSALEKYWLPSIWEYAGKFGAARTTYLDRQQYGW